MIAIAAVIAPITRTIGFAARKLKAPLNAGITVELKNVMTVEMLDIKPAIGPIAAMNPKTVKITVCVPVSKPPNHFIRSVIFWIIGVIIGRSCCPNVDASSFKLSFAVLILFAVPSAVFAKSPCAFFVAFSTYWYLSCTCSACVISLVVFPKPFAKA